MMLLELGDSTMLINGVFLIRNKRGLKQGNPLSSQLFILVIDVLGRIFSKAASENTNLQHWTLWYSRDRSLSITSCR